MRCGFGFIPGGASLQNHLSFNLLKESARSFSELFTYLAKTLLLLIRLFRLISRKRYMQFLHEDAALLIIFMTAILSQNKITLVLVSKYPKVRRAAVNPNNSRYSMVAFILFTYPGSHCAKIHLWSKNDPKT